MTATRERETASEPRSRRGQPRTLLGKTGEWFEERLKVARPTRHYLNKVFPDHWSFMMGEIALYSFIVLLLTGTFLTFFFDAAMGEVRYNGSYQPLQGVEMSQAYASTLHISFDVRGGLVIRQIHHWAALMFIAAMLIHMGRIFFTGAFRKPRELNWIIGISLIVLGVIEGFAGYSLPDDLLSGTGLRIADAIMLSIPVIGSWVSFAVFDGEFPGTAIVGRLYIVHVLLIPAILLALITVHLALIVRQKHTQFPGAGRTESSVSGERVYPIYAAKAGGFFFIVFGVLAALGGFAQINPIWLFGPYNPAQVTSGAQPDWYMAMLDGSTRLFPSWEIHGLFGRYTVPAVFWPTVVLPTILIGLAVAYPFIEARLTKDRAKHHLLQRPRDVPVRTSLGAMALTFCIVLFISGGNDLVAVGVRYLAERHDVGWPRRADHPAAACLCADVPDLPWPAAPRPRGARARHRDRHHPPPAHGGVHRGAPTARPGGRPRSRRAQLRRGVRAQAHEPARHGRVATRPWLFPASRGETGDRGEAGRGGGI